MPKLNNSKLLDQVLSRAAELKNASSSAPMRLEFVLVAVIDLINEGKLDLDHKISHTFNILDAQKAFDFNDSRDPSIRKIVFTFDD